MSHPSHMLAFGTAKQLFPSGMSATAEHATQTGLLEALVDTFGLGTIVAAMADVCDSKAEHLRTNWQDHTTANAWERARDALIKVALSERASDVTTA